MTCVGFIVSEHQMEPNISVLRAVLDPPQQEAFAALTPWVVCP